MISDSTSRQQIQYLKLGGSLITDKTKPHTPRLEVIERLAHEIYFAWKKNNELQLIIGHGSGSFGHVAAKKYGTRGGVNKKEDWLGFVEVWHEAALLNRIVLDALYATSLPVIAFSPAAMIITENGEIIHWDLQSIRSALTAGLIPVIQGDTIFDIRKGGTILSTEELFIYLSMHIPPQRVLLAGIEPGVWADYPFCTRVVEEITTHSEIYSPTRLNGSSATDVTGGMASKVDLALRITELCSANIYIFSGETPGTVQQALNGAQPGTCIKP